MKRKRKGREEKRKGREEKNTMIESSIFEEAIEALSSYQKYRDVCFDYEYNMLDSGSIMDAVINAFAEHINREKLSALEDDMYMEVQEALKKIG